MSRKVRSWIRVSLLAVVAAAVCTAATARATVIAEWNFDGAGTGAAAFEADSSGNGNDLGNNQVAQSSITATGAGYSAYFDSSKGAGFWTNSTLNLTSYRNLRISWSQLVKTDQVGMVFEHSPIANFNPGGFQVDVNELSAGKGLVLTSNSATYTSAPPSLNYGSYTHASGATNTTWENMRLEINLDAASTDSVLKLYRGETLVSAYSPPPYGGDNQGAAPSSFGNYYFNIGCRQAGSMGFTGYIDNMTIESIPEPGTLALVTTGMLGLLCYAWRKRRW